MENDAYTLAMWRGWEGREEEFVRAWREDLAGHFLSLPNPPGVGTLIRSVEAPRYFTRSVPETAWRT